MAALEYENKNIAILGFGEEGQAAYRYFRRNKANVVVFDEKSNHAIEELPNEVPAHIGVAKVWELDGFDLVIRSPGIAPQKFQTSSSVSSVTGEFFEKCPSPIIGVTGTKGKGTTASLIYEILTRAGRRAHLLGNIGKPALDSLDDIYPGDVVVYELSSFQLWDMNKSPGIAVVLMIQPEHLDVHQSLKSYLDAKANITLHQTVEDAVIFHPTNPESAKIASKSKGSKYRYLTEEAANIVDEKLVVNGTEIMNAIDFGLLGPHNRENICAALSASWQISQDTNAARDAITEFKGLEHRLEFAGEVDGVKYYNDSFATVPEASIAAMKSFNEPEIVILGGSDKHSDYSSLAKYALEAGNAKQLVLIGKSAPKLQDALDNVGFTDYQLIGGDMKSIVAKSSEIAKRGDVVLLSPACASFDMFDSYKQRGKQFKQAVEEL